MPVRFASVTSDRVLAQQWRQVLEPLGRSHHAFDGLVTAMRRLGEVEPDILLIDSTTAGLSLDQLGTKIRHRTPSADVLFTGEDSTSSDVRALERWTLIPIVREVEALQLRSRLQTIVAERQLVSRCRWIGITQQIRSASDLLLAAAGSDATVLIEGESGTGKELAARAVHQNSSRTAKPFLALNCSAFPETLLESELFGHEKGAFTDAFARKKGIFEAVEGGTIFLDEIGETSPAVQARLLRVLEERQVRPIGAAKAVPVEFRIVAATNRDLQRAVNEGSFRRDLYFRLAVVQMTLPPLRDRRGDIPVLLLHHLRTAANSQLHLTNRLDEEALARLVDYDWPGNVRELRNFTERTQVRFPDTLLTRDSAGSLLESVRTSINLPVATGRRTENVEREMIFAALSELKRDLDFLKTRVERLSHPGDIPLPTSAESGSDFASMREVERERMALALRQTHGNRAKAARLLGIGERTLYRKLKEYGL